MPRMTVKGVVSPSGILLWYHHCPLCPDWPSVGYPQSGACHDDARKHAERHTCKACNGKGVWLTINPFGRMSDYRCIDCGGRGWV